MDAVEEDKARAERGIVLGRFQPFHNGHLEFVKLAKEKCDFLTVFVGEFFSYERGTSKRSFHDAFRSVAHGFGKDTLDPNPFSYEERKEMIERSLLKAGLDAEEFEVRALSLKNFLQTPGRVYIRDGYGGLSYKTFGATLLGRDMENIGRRNGISGKELRELLRDGKPVSELIPEAAQNVISRRTVRV